MPPRYCCPFDHDLEEKELLARREAASRLASLSRGARSGADARGASAAAAPAVSITEALTGDELFARTVTHVLGTIRVERWAAGRGDSWCRGGVCGGGNCRRSSRSARAKTATGFTGLKLRTRAGADASGVRAATTPAISVAETLAANELLSSAVAHVLVPRRIERRSGVCHKGDYQHSISNFGL